MPNRFHSTVALRNISSSQFLGDPLDTCPPSFLCVTFRPDLPLNAGDFRMSQPWPMALSRGFKWLLCIYYIPGTRLCESPWD